MREQIMLKNDLFKLLDFFVAVVFISLVTISGCGSDDGGDGDGVGGPESTRTIKLINNCNETIWVGSLNLGTSSTGWELIGSSEGCKSDADCQTGLTTTATCNTATEKCEQDVSVPAKCRSCQVWARTGCNFNSSGLCNDVSINDQSKFNCCATGGCTVTGGKWGLECLSGAQSPFTVVEFSFSQTSNPVTDNDFYDVSIIDGMNVPAEIEPVGSQIALPPNFPPDYWCGNPGSSMSNTNKTLDCPWVQLSDSTNNCNKNPGLRAVNPTIVEESFTCGSTSKNMFINGVGNVCTCSSDGDCNTEEICGVGNNQILGIRVCGTFAGCTSPKHLCGIGQYFSHKTGGETCTSNPECASGNCDSGKCTASPMDFLDCNKKFTGTPSCEKNSDCPLLTGILFTDQSTCKSNCPEGTECLQTAFNTKTQVADWGCQMTCENMLCQSGTCSSDSDCTTLPNMQASGTFMLCDEASGKCVSTKASLFEAVGINGQSCYNPGGSFDNVKFNAATTFCAGCPTNCECQKPPCLCPPWPIPDKQCTTTAEGAGIDCGSVQCSNPDWEQDAKPITLSFKQACPAAYTFPFDDPSGTFQCRGTGSTNTLGYNMTFCPSR